MRRLPSAIRTAMAACAVLTANPIGRTVAHSAEVQGAKRMQRENDEKENRRFVADRAGWMEARETPRPPRRSLDTDGSGKPARRLENLVERERFRPHARGYDHAAEENVIFYDTLSENVSLGATPSGKASKSSMPSLSPRPSAAPMTGSVGSNATPSGKASKSPTADGLAGKRSKTGKTSGKSDKSGDNTEELEDLILVSRSVADPLGEIIPGTNLDADVNGDGLVDVQDIVATIADLTDLLGPEALGELTPTYFDNETDFPWVQPPLNETEDGADDRRSRLLRDEAIQAKGDWEEPEWLSPSNRRLATCGAATALSLAKGTGPKPSINWDTGNCVFDSTVWPNMSAAEKAKAYADWAFYGTLLAGAFLVQPDGAKAYANYRDDTGAEVTVDYEKAIQEEPAIAAKVDLEVADVVAAAKELFDGEEASFGFHSTSARSVPNGSSPNWQKALGGHRIWSEGTVTYDAGSCQLTVDFTIFAEDYYNFNPGQTAIGSGLPDNDNCLFAIIGWASPFYSRGEIARTETIDLVCCEDDDCGDVTEFDCECNLCVTQCPTNQASGGQGFTSFSVDLFKTEGIITVYYQMYTIPDQLKIYYEGAVIFTTGGLVSGSSTTQVSYGSATTTSTVVTVEINAPNSGTAWVVSVSCPP